MRLFKIHEEFHALDMTRGWAVPEGYPPGIEEKIIAGGLDEPGGAGHRTRLLRFLPGARSTEPFVHDYWEEVLLLSGDLWVGRPGEEQRFEGFTFACRPPGVPHGPFRSERGCLLAEFHYYLG